MEEYLAYKFPNGSLKCYTGRWVSTPMESLPSDVFFITSFNKSHVFYFEPFKEQLLSQLPDEVHNVAPQKENVLSKEAYLDKVAAFKNAFSEKGIQKAIFSRIRKEERNEQSVRSVFIELMNRYSEKACVYWFSGQQIGTWLGATPEILLEGNKEEIHAMSLAGTKAEQNTPWTDKEYEEQQLVTDYMEEVIKRFSPSVFQKGTVSTLNSGAVYHLCTRFKFKLAPSNWRNLMAELHPTPAVCGLPKQAAYNHILDSEPHNRLFYTGIIGYLGKEMIQTYVNLRCMKVDDQFFKLFLGGGITEASVVADEWTETEAKAKTLLAAIREA